MSAKHVLTAAHCLFYVWGGVLPSITVLGIMGQIELELLAHSILSDVSRIIPHPNYIKEKSQNDIGMLEVSMHPLCITVIIGTRVNVLLN